LARLLRRVSGDTVVRLVARFCSAEHKWKNGAKQKQSRAEVATGELFRSSRRND